MCHGMARKGALCEVQNRRESMGEWLENGMEEGGLIIDAWRWDTCKNITTTHGSQRISSAVYGFESRHTIKSQFIIRNTKCIDTPLPQIENEALFHSNSHYHK